MYSILTFTISVLLTAMLAVPLIGREANRHEDESNVRIGNFLVYRDAVREFMVENPGFDGVISPSSLDLPASYRNLGWSNEANAGTAWIYGDMPPGGLRRAVEKMDRPVNLGVKESGNLVSPVHGDTGIAVPAFVSEGQVAAVIRNI